MALRVGMMMIMVVVIAVIGNDGNGKIVIIIMMKIETGRVGDTTMVVRNVVNDAWPRKTSWGGCELSLNSPSRVALGCAPRKTTLKSVLAFSCLYFALLHFTCFQTPHFLLHLLTYVCIYLSIQKKFKYFANLNLILIMRVIFITE